MSQFIFQIKFIQTNLNSISDSLNYFERGLWLIEYILIIYIILIKRIFKQQKKFVLLEMVLGKFVEVGRVVKINYGPQEGKLATIVEILNDKRVLIDGPTTGVQRQVIPIRRLTLTKFNLKGATRGARTGVITKAIKKSDPFAQYQNTSCCQETKLTDFDRFRVMILRKRRSALLSTQLKSLRKNNAGGKAAAQAKGGNKKK
ncbi:unnamed protein product (macronuclear) [Paramecium tetraurelia]|uniref:KOW domain-containing protein n=1 Tax=Paramecium tetraurelia TaxID=5888 RepID=A0CTC3_PARTE|nr:uncharacterized protein GSPATT00010274001 [Paramecium tetraurelia]CAK74040.1 unnamed protein product [Paramecium tetraurelia]|eukprot:XP_001441437.1 hypothetical protein (macronuclear) [Paramecium tetraurelia strain d4-2]